MNSEERDDLIVARDYLPKSISWVKEQSEFQEFDSIWNKFRSQTLDFPHDPRFNAVFWAYDLSNLCREIIFGFCWSEAWAEFYKKKIPEGEMPSNSFMQLSFYAGNCITLIDSCRDKLALMVWSYFCSFDPNKRREVLVFEEVFERLQAPIKFGLKLENHQEFLECLEKIKGEDFNRIEVYRHLKIHRLEPRIELYKKGPHQEIPYLVPLVSVESIQKFKESLKERYPEPDFRETIFEQCKIEGILFSTISVKNQIWEYDTIRNHIKNCMLRLLEATSGCWDELLKRPPLLK